MSQIMFGISSYQSRSLQLSAQRIVNAMVEREPEGTKSQVPVFGLPGLTALWLLAQTGVRGFWNFNGVLHVVSGPSLYSVTRSGTISLIGTGILGDGNVSMSDNGLQLVIVNGVQGFIYGPATAYQQIVNINFYPANTVLFFDGYFVFDRVDTNQFFLSDLYDGLSYSGTDFATAEAQPGFLIAVGQNLQMLYLFCQNHIEMWYDAGAADFPFQRYAGGVIPHGTNAPLSVVPLDEQLLFLGTDLVFYRLVGNNAQRLSTHAIEGAWAKYSTVNDAVCFTITLEGHKLVYITFPTAGHTWGYDLTTEKWHERESWDADCVSLGRWRANCAIRIYDKNIIGDFVTGDIWELDWTAWKEGDNTMPMKITSSPLHKEKMRLFLDLLELDMQAGVGLDGGVQGENPQAMLRWSKDGGMTWSDQQPWRTMGKIGEYRTRLRWLNFGVAYQWCFMLEITDPVQRVLIAAYEKSTIGMG